MNLEQTRQSSAEFIWGLLTSALSENESSHYLISSVGDRLLFMESEQTQWSVEEVVHFLLELKTLEKIDRVLNVGVRLLPPTSDAVTSFNSLARAYFHEILLWGRTGRKTLIAFATTACLVTLLHRCVRIATSGTHPSNSGTANKPDSAVPPQSSDRHRRHQVERSEPPRPASRRVDRFRGVRLLFLSATCSPRESVDGFAQEGSRRSKASHRIRL